MLDAVDVVRKVVAQRRPAPVLLPALLPQEVAVLVARHPLLPDVVDPHDHHVGNFRLRSLFWLAFYIFTKNLDREKEK